MAAASESEPPPPPAQATLLDLPDDVVALLFLRLSLSDGYALSCCSRALRDAFADEWHWSHRATLHADRRALQYRRRGRAEAAAAAAAAEVPPIDGLTAMQRFLMALLWREIHALYRQTLEKALKRKRLPELCLRRCRVTNAFLYALSLVLEKRENLDLAVVDVPGNRIGRAGVAALAHVLSARTAPLRVLDLSDNLLNDAAARELARVVAACRDTLEVLNVGGNSNILSAGLTDLIPALGVSQVHELRLSGLRLGGMRDFGDLASCPLRLLDVSGCGLDDECARSFCHFLSACTTLRTLLLSGNSFSDELLAAIVRAAPRELTELVARRMPQWSTAASAAVGRRIAAVNALELLEIDFDPKHDSTRSVVYLIDALAKTPRPALRHLLLWNIGLASIAEFPRRLADVQWTKLDALVLHATAPVTEAYYSKLFTVFNRAVRVTPLPPPPKPKLRR